MLITHGTHTQHTHASDGIINGTRNACVCVTGSYHFHRVIKNDRPSLGNLCQWTELNPSARFNLSKRKQRQGDG